MSVLKINLSELTGQFLKEIKEKFGKTAEVEIRTNAAADAPVLSEDLFWEVVDSFDWSKKNGQAILAPGIEKLAAQETVFIYLFADALYEKLFQLNTKTHAAVFAKKQNAHFSADDFLYARCAVVAEGKNYFEKVLNNPSEMPTDIIFEPLLNLATAAYHKKTGKEFNYIPTKKIETHEFR